MPDSGNPPRTLRASAIPDTHCSYSVSRTINQQLTAIGAISVFPIAHKTRQVTGVNEVEPFRFSKFCSTQQRSGRSIFRIGHFVVLMECGDVPRDIPRDSRKELRDVAKLFVTIVESWDDERHDFQPKAHRMQALNRFENVFQHAAQLAVIAVLETFEVDFVKVHPGLDIFQDLRGSVAV